MWEMQRHKAKTEPDKQYRDTSEYSGGQEPVLSLVVVLSVADM